MITEKVKKYPQSIQFLNFFEKDFIIELLFVKSKIEKYTFLTQTFIRSEVLLRNYLLISPPLTRIIHTILNLKIYSTLIQINGNRES